MCMLFLLHNYVRMRPILAMVTSILIALRMRLRVHSYIPSNNSKIEPNCDKERYFLEKYHISSPYRTFIRRTQKIIVTFWKHSWNQLLLRLCHVHFTSNYALAHEICCKHAVLSFTSPLPWDANTCQVQAASSIKIKIGEIGSHLDLVMNPSCKRVGPSPKSLTVWLWWCCGFTDLTSQKFSCSYSLLVRYTTPFRPGHIRQEK